jgi:hypothetical protein
MFAKRVLPPLFANLFFFSRLFFLVRVIPPFFQKLLTFDPHSRSPAVDLLGHPYFEGYGGPIE